MVTSLVLTGTYNIGISNDKIKTPDGVTINLKDVPFIRYRFSKYGETEIDFIKQNMQKFKCLHIAEITVDEDTIDTIEAVRDISDKIGIMLYVDVSDNDVAYGIPNETLDILASAYDYDVDYINIRDKSTTLDGNSIARLIRQVRESCGVEDQDNGLCGGPCCFYDGRACLTAVKARAILAKYSDDANVVVPSANHEGKLDTIESQANCVNRCGCIRYHIYNHDVEAPVTKSTSKTPKKSVTTGQTKKPKTVKRAAPKGIKIVGKGRPHFNVWDD